MGNCCRQQKRTYRHKDAEIAYEIGHCIGKGKTGLVYYGTHKRTKRKVAIKIIQQAYLTTAARRMAVQMEIQLLSQLHHPGIIEYIEAFESSERICIIMEYLPCGSILRPLSRGTTEAQIASIIRQIASALRLLHQRKITHRDIKPENVLWASEDKVKLIDFGIAHQGRTDMTGMTGTGHYMAPEIFGRDSRYGNPVDIWSLGVMTYVLLFGTYPFDGQFLSQIEDSVLQGIVHFPQDLVPFVSSNAVDFIQYLLNRSPQARPVAYDVLRHPWLMPGGASTAPLATYHQSKITQFVQREYGIE